MKYLNDEEKEAIAKLLNQIKDRFQIVKVILFGSKAKGTHQLYSDINLILLSNKEVEKKDREIISTITADINIDYGIGLSCIYCNASEWEKGVNINPFLKESVDNEGVMIYG